VLQRVTSTHPRGVTAGAAKQLAIEPQRTQTIATSLGICLFDQGQFHRMQVFGDRLGGTGVAGHSEH
jgi:hypothetical protein